MIKLIMILAMSGTLFQIGNKAAEEIVQSNDEVEVNKTYDTVEETDVNKDEIEFFHGTWQEALDKAKSEGKLIFLDAMAAWCGPCKIMARRTFTDDEVAEYFNTNFVNLKMDMEKGEGPSLSNKFGITAYPTLIIVDHKGKEMGKSIGLLSPSQLLDFGKSYN